jgi:hypothetical protein
MGAVMTLSNDPGPQTVRVQAAITGVEIKTEGMKAYEVVPVTAIFGATKALQSLHWRRVRRVRLEFLSQGGIPPLHGSH